MPVACIPLEETNRTILSKSYFKVVQDLLEQTNISCGVLIAMHKGMEVNRTDFETNATANTKTNLPTTVSKRRVIVDISEEYNEDALTTTAVSYRDTAPIFADPQIDLYVFPVYVTSDITLKITFSTPSKSEANKLRDEIRMKLSQMRNIAHHEVEYDIILPETVQDIITDTHELKKRLYPMELSEYFHTFATRQFHMLTDMTHAKNAQIAIRERQVRIVGKFDYNPMPDVVEENHDTNSYALTIPYKFTMEVPRGMCMSYSPMVCNKPMPAKYLKWIQESKVRTREEYSRNLSYTSSLGALSYFEAHRQIEYRLNNKLPLNIPLFDEFPMREGHVGYMITTTFLTDVNEDDRKTLFNLKELPDFYMNEKFLNYLKSGERQYVTRPYQSGFYFGLHYPGRYFDFDGLEITEDLTVKSKVELPLDKPVRVAFSVLADPDYAKNDIFTRWIENKEMFLMWLSEFFFAWRDYGQELGNKVIGTNSVFELLLKAINKGLTFEDNQGFLNRLFEIVYTNNFFYEQLITTLRNRYPYLYNQLMGIVTSVSLQTHIVGKFGINNIPVDKQLRRTVMTAYTQALRQE